jgi:glycerophosphoryl diester phosphodiesterase
MADAAGEISWLTRRPIAHRGLHDGNRAVWENTLPAFTRAIERGYAIECDVHLTADGVPVVFHDDGLLRLAGEEGFVWQRTAAEMRALKIGGLPHGAPSLGELLQLVSGRVPLVIELKGIAGHDDGLVARVAEALQRYRGQVALMSFDHWIVRRFPLDAPGIPAGLTAYGTSDALIEGHFSMLANGIAFVSYDVASLPNRFVAFVREKLGMPVITWTIRDQAGRDSTLLHGDQMTFEGFEPEFELVA